jgi:hypothetical protein
MTLLFQHQPIHPFLCHGKRFYLKADLGGLRDRKQGKDWRVGTKEKIAGKDQVSNEC